MLNWFLSGWTLLVFVFLYVPIAVLVGYSFNASRLNDLAASGRAVQ